MNIFIRIAKEIILQWNNFKDRDLRKHVNKLRDVYIQHERAPFPEFVYSVLRRFTLTRDERIKDFMYSKDGVDKPTAVFVTSKDYQKLVSNPLYRDAFYPEANIYYLHRGFVGILFGLPVFSDQFIPRDLVFIERSCVAELDLKLLPLSYPIKKLLRNSVNDEELESHDRITMIETVNDQIDFYNKHKKVRLENAMHHSVKEALHSVCKQGKVSAILFISGDLVGLGQEALSSKTKAFYFGYTIDEFGHLGKIDDIVCITDKGCLVKYIDGIQLVYTEDPFIMKSRMSRTPIYGNT